MYINFISEVGKRNKWTIYVPATTLLRCCAERVTHHLNRLKFWRREKELADKNLKENGIKVSHHAISGGFRTDAQLDPSLSERLTECTKKVEEHLGAIRRFRAFAAFFSQSITGAESATVPVPQFELNADDVLYFNLENADDGTETNEEILE